MRGWALNNKQMIWAVNVTGTVTCNQDTEDRNAESGGNTNSSLGLRETLMFSLQNYRKDLSRVGGKGRERRRGTRRVHAEVAF